MVALAAESESVILSWGGEIVNLKELIFGGGVKHAAGGGAYRDSIQAWLPIKNIIGGVVVTKDNRFIKILGGPAGQHLSEITQ